MKIYKIIGPDCVRTETVLSIMQDARKEGFTPLINIAMDNKSTLVWSDYIPGVSLMPDHQEILRNANQNTIYVGATEVVTHIAQLEYNLDYYQKHGAPKDRLQKLPLFRCLDYLMSALMFCDKMPNADLLLEPVSTGNESVWWENQHVDDQWKLQTFPQNPDPHFARVQNVRLALFLATNGIMHTVAGNQIIIHDVLQFAHGLIRLVKAPAANLFPLLSRMPPPFMPMPAMPLLSRTLLPNLLWYAHATKPLPPPAPEPLFKPAIMPQPRGPQL